MVETSDENRDLALVIAWPDQTARGDEQWMALLKRLGLVKNLNFKVGHAAIVLVDRQTGLLAYYDFGRYITPRGYGRARSAASDPRLVLSTRAEWDESNQICNLQAILAELHQIEYATHGGGRLFFSVATGLSYQASTNAAQHIVDRGPVKYGAVAKGNNSCSRFVAQVLLAGLPRLHPVRLRLCVPESLKPSPMSNVVNASPDRTVYCYYLGRLESRSMTRWQSLCFQVNLLGQNFSASKSRLLPCDREPGSIGEPHRPSSVPKAAQWLGGIGEGAWYMLEHTTKEDHIQVVRYNHEGNEDYRANCVACQAIEPNKPYRFTYHCHYQRHTVMQSGRTIILETVLFRHSHKQIKTA